MSAISPTTVAHIAALANLPVAIANDPFFVSSFSAIVDLISTASAMDTENIPETSQVTGLENVYRDDIVDSSRQFTQAQALINAHHTHKGYFVVPSVFE